MNMRGLILQSVEWADGWQFVPSHSLVKVPGSTEPVDPTRMGTVALAGLADQLIFQIDSSEHLCFSSDKDGQCNVTNAQPKGDQPQLTSAHGESRSVNALTAISQSKYFR